MSTPVQNRPSSAEPAPADASSVRTGRRLRIVHAVSSLQVGGMEQFVLQIAAAQQQSGHEVAVLALQGGPLLEAARRQGIKVYALGGRRKELRVLRALLLLARLRPDIMHAHNPTSLHYAVLGKRAGGAKVVLTYHGRGGADARTPSAQEWHNTDAVVVVSQGAVGQLEAPEYRDKLSVILNGISPATPARDRQTVRAELVLTEERAVGIMVARMDGLKGHETLLQAAALLREAGTPVTLLLVGDGSERANLEKQAQESGLNSDCVRFLGYRSDVPDLLAASDFFLLPSLTEGLPLSVLEAMSQRLPVVATPVGGIPEVVHSGQHGLLVPVRDPQALAAAITEMVADPEHCRALGEAAYQRVRETFSIEAMTRQYETLYYSLL